MSYKQHWASPSTTSGWQNYPGGWVYTGGLPMPTARLDFYGNRPIRVHSFGDYYISSGFMRMNYGGSLLDAGGIAVFGGSGGSFQWEAHSDSQMFFGRDLGAGRTVTSFNDGFVWSGTLAGSFWWDQVPANPGCSVSASGRDLVVTVTAPDNGGTGIDLYRTQISKDGGAWYDQRDGGSKTYADLDPGSYRARAWAHNAVGFSQPTTSNTVEIRAGGKRYSGSAFVVNTTAKRYTGSSWTNLTTAKRYTGSAWTDLS